MTKLSPLAPERFPIISDISGVGMTSVACGVKYSGICGIRYSGIRGVKSAGTRGLSANFLALCKKRNGCLRSSDDLAERKEFALCLGGVQGGPFATLPKALSVAG